MKAHGLSKVITQITSVSFSPLFLDRLEGHAIVNSTDFDR